MAEDDGHCRGGGRGQPEKLLGGGGVATIDPGQEFAKGLHRHSQTRVHNYRPRYSLTPGFRVNYKCATRGVSYLGHPVADVLAIESTHTHTDFCSVWISSNDASPT